MAKQDHEYGVGERTDGTIDVFPASELQQRLAEWRAKEAGETGEDDLGDLSEIEKLFEAEPADEEAEDAFNEADHPRGQPENAGEFASAPGGGKSGLAGSATSAKTGRPWKGTLHRGTGDPKASANRTPSQYAEGEHWTLNREHAESYGPDVKSREAELRNPYVFDLPGKKPYYQELKAEFGTDDPKEISRLLLKKGHDALVVRNVPIMRKGIAGKGSEVVLLKPEGGKTNIRKSMNKVSEVAPATQPVKSLDELYDRAKAEEPAFRKMVEDIAEVTGSKPKFSEKDGSILKTRESSERKMRDELGGDFTKVRDMLRGTVVADSVEKTRDAAATFVAKQGDNVLRVKDRHVGPTSSGYRDILVNFRTPGGLVAELQFNSKAMTEAKEASGHKLYDAIRGGELAGKTFDELQAAARAIYEKAYVDDGDGHWEMQT